MTDQDPKSLIRIARENGAEETGQPVDLGARVRELRKARDWTLEQAANQAGHEHDLLAENLTQKSMLPYRAHIRARSMDEFDGWVRHDGEEFLYVLTGEITLFTEFYEPTQMKRGDSAYYDAAMGHNVISTSAEDATILWVTSLS